MTPVSIDPGTYRLAVRCDNLARCRPDFRRSLESGLCSSQRRGGRSAGSFPEQRLVIEPTLIEDPGEQQVTCL